MWKIALKSTLAKKRRLLATALSVMIGVAFLAGTLVFTDTIQRTFDDLFAGIYADTDSYVRSATSIDMGQGVSQRARVPGSTVSAVAATPGVVEAQGLVSGYAQIVGHDGRALGNPGMGAPTLGMSHITGKLSPWQLTPGSREPGPGELAIDKGSADLGKLRLGDQVTVLTQTGPHQFTLVGTARFGSVDSPGGASVALFDLATAQKVLLGGLDEVDAVMVRAVDGVSQQQITARIASTLPKGMEALTGAQITKENQDVMRKGLGFLSTFLLVFAAIGLVVACFTIYNTFQIIVTQRSREMALLRSIGATSRQVMWAQLLEAVILGVIASVIGLFAGVAVAGGLKAMMAAFGIDIPAGGTVFAARTAIVAMGVGTIVTVVSAVFPSRRASRVPPIAAIREIAFDATGSHIRPRLIQGGILTACGHRRVRPRIDHVDHPPGRHRCARHLPRRVHPRTAHRPTGGADARCTRRSGRWRRRRRGTRERRTKPEAHRSHRRGADGRRHPGRRHHRHRRAQRGTGPTTSSGPSSPVTSS